MGIKLNNQCFSIMADDRKENGGARAGAGRKPKADEIKLIEQMDAVLVPGKLWEALAEKVKDKDVNAIKTWLSYRYGMPKQQIENTIIDNTENVSISFTKDGR